ncbi:MAG: MgtC/SapB family protein [Candidatus Paceibacterota bacterium]|jgi:putative Mg2+ transporter-C (MgtC) family protein
MITLTLTEIIIRVAIAVGLGALLGLERTLAGKTAGMRTYSMVSLGSAIFVIVSQIILSPIQNLALSNPLLMASAIVTGIGFIGAGLVIFQDHKIVGLTTAAGLWVSAGVGIASGYGLFQLSLVAIVAAIVIFTVLWFIENLLKRLSYNNEKEN